MFHCFEAGRVFEAKFKLFAQLFFIRAYYSKVLWRSGIFLTQNDVGWLLRCVVFNLFLSLIQFIPYPCLFLNSFVKRRVNNFITKLYRLWGG